MRRAWLLVWAVIYPSFMPAQAGQTTVVFRLDDYCARSNAGMEARIIDAFRARGLCCTVGVIPCARAGDISEGGGPEDGCLSAGKISLLREAMATGVVDVALHGYSHSPIARWTEFAGLGYDRQLVRIREGRDLLSRQLGGEITTFIPPWNSYDADTLRALDELGFLCISGDKSGGVGRLQSSLRFLPCTCGPTELQRAVRSARRGEDALPIVVVLFHLYDFVEIDSSRGVMTFEAFEELLDWTVSQEDLSVRSIRGVLSSDADLSAERFAGYKSLADTPQYVPPFLTRLSGIDTPLYLPSAMAPHLKQARSELWMCTAAFYLVVALVSACVTSLGARVLSAGRQTAVVIVPRYVMAVVLPAALAYGLRDLTLGYNCALACSGLLGFTTGLWLHPAERTRRWTGAEPVENAQVQRG